MFNLKLAAGIATVGLAGSYIFYQSLKSKFEKAASIQVVPEKPVLVRLQEKKSLPTPLPHITTLSRSGLALTAAPVRAALNIVVTGAKVLVVNGAVALTLLTKAFATTVTAKVPGPSKFAPRWLISRNDDLIYMIGSIGVSLALIYATFVLKLKPTLLFWIWALVLDGPHIWGTATRTYFDKQEWQNRKRLLLGSLAWFGIGAGLASINLQIFRSFAYTWAYYHLVKQHYGFMILYKKKNNDLAQFDNFLDKALVWVGFSYPFVNNLFKPDAPEIFKVAQQLVPASLHSFVPRLALGAFVVTLGTYLARQFYKLNTQLAFDMPKHLLLTASLGLHILVMKLPYGQIVDGFLLIIATLTAYHNVQYQRLMWFHNRNKYGKGTIAETLKTHGLAAYFGRNFWFYLGSGLIFTLFYRPFFFREARRGKYAQVLEGFFWGFAFLHYYLDSKIWKVRHDTKLNQALKLSSVNANAN